MQRIQTNAQCIVLYGSQRVELKYVQQLLSDVCNSMLIGSIGFVLVNFPIQLSCKQRKLSSVYVVNRSINLFKVVINGLCTYTMPSVVFFFIQKTQSPELAQNLLSKEMTHRRRNILYIAMFHSCHSILFSLDQSS